MSYKSQYLNQSTRNAISVLRVLQRSIHPLSTTDIAQCAGIAYDQSYRILITLETEGLVGRAGSRMWVLSDGVALPQKKIAPQRVAAQQQQEVTA